MQKTPPSLDLFRFHSRPQFPSLSGDHLSASVTGVPLPSSGFGSKHHYHCPLRWALTPTRFFINCVALSLTPSSSSRCRTRRYPSQPIAAFEIHRATHRLPPHYVGRCSFPLFSNFEYFIIQILLCNPRIYVIKLLFGLFMYVVYYLCCYLCNDMPVMILAMTNRPYLRAGCHTRQGQLHVESLW
jgi:hypothetical protein